MVNMGPQQDPPATSTSQVANSKSSTDSLDVIQLAQRIKLKKQLNNNGLESNGDGSNGANAHLSNGTETNVIRVNGNGVDSNAAHENGLDDKQSNGLDIPADYPRIELAYNAIKAESFSKDNDHEGVVFYAKKVDRDTLSVIIEESDITVTFLTNDDQFRRKLINSSPTHDKMSEDSSPLFVWHLPLK